MDKDPQYELFEIPAQATATEVPATTEDQQASDDTAIDHSHEDVTAVPDFIRRVEEDGVKDVPLTPTLVRRLIAADRHDSPAGLTQPVSPFGAKADEAKPVQAIPVIPPQEGGHRKPLIEEKPWYRRPWVIGVAGVAAVAAAATFAVSRGGNHHESSANAQTHSSSTLNPNTTTAAPAPKSSAATETQPTSVPTQKEFVDILGEPFKYQPTLITGTTSQEIFDSWTNDYQALTQTGATPWGQLGNKAQQNTVSAVQEQITKDIWGTNLETDALQGIRQSIVDYNNYILNVDPNLVDNVTISLLTETTDEQQSVLTVKVYDASSGLQVKTGPQTLYLRVTLNRTTPEAVGLPAPNPTEPIWIVANQETLPSAP